MSKNFENAFEKLIGLEGGYVNDPDDKGGETKFGISKRSYPYVNIKDLTLEEAQVIYKRDFWDKFKGDLLPFSVAEELFELSVNVGAFRATFILQTTINLLNRNEASYKDVRVDGRFGEKTFESLKLCIKENKEDLIFNLLNILQGAHYIELMINEPVYEKYIGWFKRVEVKKL